MQSKARLTMDGLSEHGPHLASKISLQDGGITSASSTQSNAYAYACSRHHRGDYTYLVESLTVATVSSSCALALSLLLRLIQYITCCLINNNTMSTQTPRDLFENDDDAAEEEIRVNKRFAKEYSSRKQREELRNAEQQQQQQDSDDLSTSSSEESEDENGDLLSPSVDIHILKVSCGSVPIARFWLCVREHGFVFCFPRCHGLTPWCSSRFYFILIDDSRVTKQG